MPVFQMLGQYSKTGEHGDLLYQNFEYDQSQFSPLSPAGMSVDLLPFQKDGIGWMAHREKHSAGGILADHLGMGKTVQMIGLCLASTAERKKSESRSPIDTMPFRLVTVIRQMQRISALGNCTKITMPARELSELLEEALSIANSKKADCSTILQDVHAWLKYAARFYPAYERRAKLFVDGKEDITSIDSGPELRTLVVVPASLLHQWMSEIQKKIHPSRKVEAIFYHGTDRTDSVTELESQDFVITTYNTLAMEVSRSIGEQDNFDRARAGPVFQVNWKRVILDEAHLIRHTSTLRWKSMSLLQASKKWAVTATPLHNSIEDLQNLLAFVGSPKLPLIPASNEAETVLRDPVLQRSIAKALQPVFLRRGPIMTRNGQAHVLVVLPEKHEEVCSVHLSEDECVVYNKVLADSRAAIHSLDQKIFHVFAMMLRLRQICCHHWLSEGRAVQIFMCGICRTEAAGVVKTKCGHAFCHECIVEKFRQAGEGELAARIPCPTCSASLSASSLLAAKHISSEEHILALKGKKWTSSSKVTMMLDVIQKFLAGSADDKMVVFSQFTSFLDIISVALDHHNIAHMRIDGSMQLAGRTNIIALFQERSTTRILLASKMAMGVGLNLTMANHVLVLDPWWNPAIEEQAVHRCYRIGQKKTVHVTRFVVSDTIEQYCYDICQRKKQFGDTILRAAMGDEQHLQSKVASRLSDVVLNLRFVKVGSETDTEKNLIKP